MHESNTSPAEHELIIGLKAGDDRAYRQVYRQGYALVEYLILRNGGRVEDAQDVFQEVLFVVVKNVRKPGFQLTSALNTYLYAIARNIWKTRRRDQKNNVEFKDTLHDVSDPTELDLTIKRLIEKRHVLIRQAFEQLSEQCRQILFSFYYEKKSLLEIGQAVYLDAGSIKVQKHRCMNYLKNNVEAYPDYRQLINDGL